MSLVLPESAAPATENGLQIAMRGIVESLYGPPVRRLPGLDIGRAYRGAEGEFRYGGDVVDVFHYGEGRQRRLGYQLLEDAADYEDYPDVRQPTLIFHGARDDVVPPQSSQVFAASRPNVRLEILDSGHDLLNVLDHMAPRIAAFLLPGAIT